MDEAHRQNGTSKTNKLGVDYKISGQIYGKDGSSKTNNM